MRKYLLLFLILFPFKGFADQYFCESQSNYDVRISDGRLIQNKIQ